MVVASSFELGGVDCVHGQRCELGVYTVVGVVSLMSPQQRYDDPRSPRERKRETGTVPSPTTSVSRSCRACHRRVVRVIVSSYNIPYGQHGRA